MRLGIIKLIMQHDDDAAADDDGDGVPDEVEDVCEVFWRYRRVRALQPLCVLRYKHRSDRVVAQSMDAVVVEAASSEAERPKCTMNDADRLFGGQREDQRIGSRCSL